MKAHELARVTLQNEMDLILAHRRSMRLAELVGLSLSAQTTFATAVSEVSRHSIEYGKNACLALHVTTGDREKYIMARITDDEKIDEKSEGVQYARRLVNRYSITTADNQTVIELFYNIPLSDKIDLRKVDEWKSVLRNEPAISAYEEIKRKNEQLQHLSQKLREGEQQYKTLTNALPIIIFSVNGEGHVIYSNDWLKHITGCTNEQLNTTFWDQVVHPDDTEAFRKLFHHLGSHSGFGKAQVRLRHCTSTEYFWHLLSLSPIKDEGDSEAYRIGYLVDIHAQKLVEETLKDNRELKETQAVLEKNKQALENNVSELARSNRDLQEFAYVASHDLQEPIRKISFYSDYLLNRYEGALDAKGLDYLHSIQNASHRMRNLIADLLSFAQVERTRLNLKKVDLQALVQVAVQDLEMLVEEKGAIVHIEALPVIEGDESLLAQLFQNLLSNGIKYSRDGVPPLLKVRAEQKGEEVQVHIADNGIGFEEKYLPQMFALFRRLHTGSKYQGTGLGLAICQKIVAMHKGAITATSQPGEGSEFIISLPTHQ